MEGFELGLGLGFRVTETHNLPWKRYMFRCFTVLPWCGLCDAHAEVKSLVPEKLQTTWPQGVGRCDFAPCEF